MLNDEVGLHAKLCAFLDGEGLTFQFLETAGGGQVENDVWTAGNFEAEGLDDAAAFVGGVDGDGGGVGEAEGGLPAFEGFVILVWEELRC